MPEEDEVACSSSNQMHSDQTTQLDLKTTKPGHRGRGPTLGCKHIQQRAIRADTSGRGHRAPAWPFARPLRRAPRGKPPHTARTREERGRCPGKAFREITAENCRVQAINRGTVAAPTPPPPANRLHSEC